MGRMKIKKKDNVIPFRQTLAYRMFMITLSILGFVYTVYEMFLALNENNTFAFIIAVLVGAAVAFSVFYNLDQLKHAHMSARTMKRMKRR
jgi:hypothetical protein